MTTLPPYGTLADIDSAVLNGLLDAHVSPAWCANYDHSWQRDPHTWEAIGEVLRMGPHALRADSPRVQTAPRWLHGLVIRRLRLLATHGWATGFDEVRLLERLGLVELPHDDTYVLAAVGGIEHPRETLTEDTGLQQAIVWRLFEVEGGGEVSLANIDRFRQDRWRSALLALVADRVLPRERVLVSCLDALQRDFNRYRAAWFSTTYLAAEPTPAELAAHQHRLRALLRSDVPATVSFALKHLTAVHKAGSLERSPTIPALSPVVLARAKGTAIAALRLADSLAGRDEELRASSAEIARAALGHDHADVQTLALKLLATYGGDPGSTEHLAPSVQARLGVASARADATVDGPQPQVLRPPADPPTARDLVERVAALLENASDSSELEAVLAGLATLRDPAALDPLRKRALAIRRRGPELSMRAGIAAVVLGAEDAAFMGAVLPQMRFVLRRLADVAARVRGDRPRDPLLATPDADGGFVSAETLASRLAASTGSPDPFDVTAARLRLHPDDTTAYAALGLWTSDLPPCRARIVAELHTHKWTDQGRTHRRQYYEWDIVVDGVRPVSGDHRPTVVVPGSEPFGIGEDDRSDWVDSIAAIWPQNAEHFTALVGWPVLEGASYYPSRMPEAVPVLDSLARHPGRLGPNSAAVLAAGLAAASAEQRLHAVDAFLTLVTSGRMAPTALADEMVGYTPGFIVTRWADSFSRAAMTDAGASAVCAVLTAYLPRVPSDTKGVHSLLSVLREESLRQHAVLTDPALLIWLGAFAGSSRAAKTARALLGR